MDGRPSASAPATNPARGRGVVGRRARLLRCAFTAAALGASLGLLAAVAVHLLHVRLQAQYDLAAPAASPEAARTVTTEYVAPALWAVCGLSVAAFVILAAHHVRPLGGPELAAAARDLSLLSAFGLLVQLPVFAVRWNSGAYSSGALARSCLLAVLGLSLLLLRRPVRSAWQTVANAVGAAVTFSLISDAVLISPVITAVAATLTAAAVLQVLAQQTDRLVPPLGGLSQRPPEPR